MSNSLFTRYIWLADTIRRYGRITRSQIDDCWRRSSFSNGRPMPRRTFCNYRQGIQDVLGITIECDPKTYEYYISEKDDHERSVTDWLLNSTAMSNTLTNARDVAGRIFLEDVPSAREYLGTMVEAMREERRVNFDYHPYTRSRPTTGIVFEPYLLKIFKQRWYVTGRHVADNRLKTYALDRITRCTVTAEHYTPDPAFDAETYFHDAFGIVVDEGNVYDIVLKVEPRQAKYFRALPLHHSQQEWVHDSFSNFHYRMRVTEDLVRELLSYGSLIEVLQPRHLRSRMQDELRRALAAYAPASTEEKASAPMAPDIAGDQPAGDEVADHQHP